MDISGAIDIPEDYWKNHDNYDIDIGSGTVTPIDPNKIPNDFSSTASGHDSAFDSILQSIQFSVDSANQVSRENTEAAMRFNAEQAALNREWQERMSNTAYQRARADLEAAGYNPILAQTQGAASTPSGTSASAAAADSHMAGADVQKLQAVVAVVKAVFDGIGKIF